MNEMVERVCRALNEQRADPTANHWAQWEKFARAAIAAMREPTEAMVKAGDDTPTAHS